MAGLLSVAEAHARLLSDVAVIGEETVPLAAAHGRVLAHDLRARLTQPPFDASAMDGYAVRASDLAQLPATLTVIGEAAAGRNSGKTLGAGECVRIFTGAPLPPGADAIVIQEDVERQGEQIRVRAAVATGTYVRRRGYDFSSGDALVAAGTVLGPRSISLAAAMGHGSLNLRRRPVVAILATGDELVAPGETPGPDQIVSSTPHGLAPMIAAAGGEPRLLGIARDSLASLDQHIAMAADADILLTIGGASVGEHDLVHKALSARGMALDFWRIAMRPGKPLLFGRLGGQRVLGLPGNPVSAFVCARVFLMPLIRSLLGLAPHRQGRFTATLGAAIEANGPRQHYMRASSDRSSSTPVVTADTRQDSSLLSVLTRSDCLIVRVPNAPALAAGSEVEVLELDF